MFHGSGISKNIDARIACERVKILLPISRPSDRMGGRWAMYGLNIMKKKIEKCCICGATPLSRDVVGINKKLRSPKIDQFYCLACLADYIGVDVETILAKIEQFKEEGCTLFA